MQSYLADSVQQPFAVLQVRDLGEDAAKRLRPAVDAELERLAAGGLDHALVEASISRAEFVMRERDFGMADGVALAMTSLCGWLYDDDLATAYLRYEDDFAYLRRALDEGYFEDLIREVFLNSAHMAEVEVVPVEKQDDPGQRRLAELAAGFADDDFQRIEDEVVLLRRMQEAPDAPEDVAKLPQLTVADVGPAPGRARLRPGRGHARSLHPPSPAHARPGLRLPLLRYELP